MKTVQGASFSFPGIVVIGEYCPENKMSLDAAIKHLVNKLVKTFFELVNYFTLP